MFRDKIEKRLLSWSAVQFKLHRDEAVLEGKLYLIQYAFADTTTDALTVVLKKTLNYDISFFFQDMLEKNSKSLEIDS